MQRWRGPDGKMDLASPEMFLLSLSQGQAKAHTVNKGLQQAPGGSWEPLPKVQGWNQGPWGCEWKAREVLEEEGRSRKGKAGEADKGGGPWAQR